jgi:ABC-type phosphate transport system substrate-binding protein
MIEGERAMRVKKIVFVAILAFAMSIVPTIAVGQSFNVVVNETNSTESMSKQALSKFFLKQTTTWINGIMAIPVDQAADSEIREAFSREIHGRDVTAIKSFWQRQIFSGRGVPPTERASDEEVIVFVQANPGAVGYVSVDAELGTGVKVLEIADR